MALDLGKTELSQILQQLSDESLENKSEPLQKLLSLAKDQTLNFSSEDLLEIFTHLKEILDVENLTYNVQCLGITQELIANYGKTTKAGFALVLSSLIDYLIDNTPVKKKMSMKILAIFAEKVGDWDLIFSGIDQYGLNSSKIENKEKIINLIPQLMNGQAEVLTSCSAFHTIFERLVVGYDDELEAARRAIANVVDTLKNSYPSQFQLFVNKMSFKSQDHLSKINLGTQVTSPMRSTSYQPKSNAPFDQMLGNRNLTPPEMFVRVGQSVVFGQAAENYHTTSRMRPSSNATESERKRPTPYKLKNISDPLKVGQESMNSLIYGVFPSQLIDDLNSAEDWKLRAASIEGVAKIVNELENITSILPHFDQFLKLMIRVANDLNFKTCLTALGIIKRIFTLAQEQHIFSFTPMLVESHIQKLGDSKIAIRQAAFQNLQLVIKKGDSSILLKAIAVGLKDLNWHVREECLMLLQTYIYDCASQLEFIEIEKVLLNVFPLLDDSKPKVKSTAIDTLVVALKSWTKDRQLHNLINNTVESSVLQIVQRKIDGTYFNSLEYLDEEVNTYASPIGNKTNNSSFIKFDQTTTNYRAASRESNRLGSSSYQRSGVTGNNGYNNNREGGHDTIEFDTSPALKTNHKFSRPPPVDSYGIQKSQSPIQFKRGYNQGYLSASIRGGAAEKFGNYETQLNKAAVMNKSNPKYPDFHPNRSRGSEKPVQSKNSSYDVVATPPLKKQGNIFELSTASSSRSKNMQIGSSIYSIESTRTNFPRIPLEYQRIRSANEAPLQSAFLQNEKGRVFSAVDENEAVKAREQTRCLRNKIAHQRLSKNKEMFLEYSVSKNIEEFSPNHFEGEGEFNSDNITLYSQFETLGRKDVFDVGSPSVQSKAIKKGVAEPTQNKSPVLKHRPMALKKRDVQPTRPLAANRKNNDDSPPLKIRSLIRNEIDDEKNARKEKDESLDEDEERKGKDRVQTSDNNAFRARYPKRKIASVKNNLKPTSTQSAPTNYDSVSFGLDYKKKNYLNEDELTPLEGKAEVIFRQALQDIKTDDWAKQFEAMNTFRRVIKYHKDEFSSFFNSSIKTMTDEVLKLIESLRSNLSKNAMLTIAEMCAELKKLLDSEVEPLIMKLIKKGSDSNVFIVEEVRKCLLAVCQNCSEFRIIPTLLNISNAKAISTKCNICYCFEAIIERNGAKFSSIRDYDKVVTTLANYMLDSALEVRTAARRLFGKLLESAMSKGDIERILQRTMNQNDCAKVMGNLDKDFSGPGANASLLITQTQSQISHATTRKSPYISKNSMKDEDFPEEKRDKSPLNKQRQSSPVDKRRLKSSNKLSFIKEGAEFDLLPNFFTEAENNDWKSRLEAVGSLTEFANRHSEKLLKSKHLLKFIDCFVKLATDSNAKVSLQAITSLTDITPLLKTALEKNSPNIIPNIAGLFASTTASIRNAAETLWTQFMEVLDMNAVLPSIANCLVFSNIKVKSGIITKLIDISSVLGNKYPSLVTRTLMPAIIKLLDQSKSEVKVPLQKLLKNLHSILDKSIFESVPANKLKLVTEALSG